MATVTSPTKPGRRIEFTFPTLLQSLNVRDKQHWAVRRRFKKDLSWEVYAVLREKGIEVPTPLPKVRITVTRNSCREVDDDNLASSVKPLLDVLASGKNGLRIILDDKPSCCKVVWQWKKVPARQQHTHVLIEEL